MEVMEKVFTWLSFIGIFWLRANGRIATDCEKYGQRVDECWKTEDGVPFCKGNDPLIVCSANNVAQMPSVCPLKLITKSQQALGVSQLLQKVVCDRKSDILEEFISRPNCWKRARMCLAKLPISFREIVYRSTPPLYNLDSGDTISIPDRTKVIAAECYKQGAVIRECYSSTSECDYLKEFTDLILQASICNSHRIEDCTTCAEKYSIADDEGKNSANKSRNILYVNLIFIFLYFIF